MLVNLLRLLGVIKTKKMSHQIVTRATQVVLPLSPNHRLFGNDGLHCVSFARRGAHPSFCAYASFGRAGAAHTLVFWGEGEGKSHLRLWEGEGAVADHTLASGARGRGASSKTRQTCRIKVCILQ